MIYLKPQRRSFINLYVGTRLCKYFFAFVSNGVVLQPSRATLCERAPARIRWCDRVLPRSPQVVFVAEIGHGRKGPVSQQIRVPCYLNGHEGVLRGDVLLSASACGAIRSYDPIRCQEPQWPRRPLAIGRRGLPLNPSRSAPGMSSTPSAQSHIRGYRSVGPHSIPSAGFPKSVEAHAEGSARTAK